MALPAPPSGGEDQLSPTTLILNYLRSQGTPITPDNIRRAVIANARGDMTGPDPVAGLRSDRPATEAEDQAAMAAARGKDGGQQSSTPPAAVNPPPADLGKVPNADEMQPAAGGGGGGGSAGGDLDLGKYIALGIPPALAASALGTIAAMNRNRGSAVSPDPNVSPTTKANMATLPPSTSVADPAPTGMEAAMQKAVGAPTVADMIAGPPAPTVPTGGAPPGAELGPQPEIPFSRPPGGAAKVPPAELFERQTQPGLTLGPQVEPNVPFNRPAGGGAKVPPTQPVVRPGTRPSLSVRPYVGGAAEVLERLRGIPR